MKSTIKAFILALAISTPAIAAITIQSACAPKTITNPETRKVYNTNEVIKRFGEIQKAVIDAANANKIKRADSVKIVTWISGDAKAVPPQVGIIAVIATAPAGWKATVSKGWVAIKPTFESNESISVWTPIIDTIVGGL